MEYWRDNLMYKTYKDLPHFITAKTPKKRFHLGCDFLATSKSFKESAFNFHPVLL
ncbi:hypothetical protein OQH61_07965 [Helicobacter sp. MIT 21-1697]|uniref:hypothetical protein n=1 Tax=Helicobacter sp. MIT 21-1697 TaxID=2993733 RepID=UPI00224B2228|nr:hypothetical protein [Helicobacter sp. MIT 21-1697]MCX2717668.1 hypothetical protein [Helicobacter sp. MIT 21-1697]